MTFKVRRKIGIGDRNFKKGDRLLCVVGDRYDSKMNKDTIYIFDHWERLHNPALLHIQGDKKAWGAFRFILANDFTELEYVIYGVNQ